MPVPRKARAAAQFGGGIELKGARYETGWRSSSHSTSDSSEGVPPSVPPPTPGMANRQPGARDGGGGSHTNLPLLLPAAPGAVLRPSHAPRRSSAASQVQEGARAHGPSGASSTEDGSATCSGAAETPRTRAATEIAKKSANPGGIATKIDDLLRAVCWRGRPLIDPEWLRPWRRAFNADGAEGREGTFRAKPPRCSVERLGLTMAGAVVYGVLFLPFTLGVLQQTMEQKRPLDPYGDDGLSSSSWGASSAFLLSLLLLCVVPLNFASDELMGRGTLGLGLFLGAVVVLIWLQQALTWYYILQRPELAVVEKQRKRKFPLCGRVYSTMNPRNPVNYFNLSLVLFEFLQERYP